MSPVRGVALRVRCPIAGQVPVTGRTGAHYRGGRCPLQGGQVPIIGGSGAHYRGVRCSLQGVLHSPADCGAGTAASAALLAEPGTGSHCTQLKPTQANPRSPQSLTNRNRNTQTTRMDPPLGPKGSLSEASTTKPLVTSCGAAAAAVATVVADAPHRPQLVVIRPSSRPD